jgi:cytochrome c peroxidase
MNRLLYSPKFLVFNCFILLLIGVQSVQPNPLHTLKEDAVERGQAFLDEARVLAEQAEDYKFKRVERTLLQAQLLKTRLAYKRVAFLWEYYYPGFSEEFLNGAPLMHLERFDSRSIVLPPQGLQVLDEMVLDAEADPAQMQIMARNLYTHAANVQAGFARRKLHEQDVIAAFRAEIVRIFTLGLTGFDTPGSLNALPEASMSLLSLKALSVPLLESLDANRAKEVENLLEQAASYLQAENNFDALDRLHVLTHFIDPLYKKVQGFAEKGQGPDALEVTARKPAAGSLFATDFLSPYFFTELSEVEDTPALRSLGKKLFYDTRLSANGALSCGSCHQPEKGFADGLPTSQSNVQGMSVQRNAPTLLNAVYADRYFYDLRAFTLEQQAEHVIFNDQEYNTAYEAILKKLDKDKTYKKLFKEALGEEVPSRNGFSKALASYVLSLQSFNSPFDQFVRGETQTLAPKIKEGFNLFMGKAACGTCHFAPTFSGLVPPLYIKNESEILGVLEKPKGWGKRLDGDMGRYANGLFSDEAWIYERSFKTSTVRNVALTAPYFHNGAYKTLEEVLTFYNHGGGAGLGLEVKNQTLAADSLFLTEGEQQAIIAFMQALTDTSVLQSAR